MIYGAPIDGKKFDSDIVSYNFDHLPGGGYKFSWVSNSV